MKMPLFNPKIRIVARRASTMLLTTHHSLLTAATGRQPNGTFFKILQYPGRLERLNV